MRSWFQIDGRCGNVGLGGNEWSWWAAGKSLINRGFKLGDHTYYIHIIICIYIYILLHINEGFSVATFDYWRVFDFGKRSLD